MSKLHKEFVNRLKREVINGDNDESRTTALRTLIVYGEVDESLYSVCTQLAILGPSTLRYQAFKALSLMSTEVQQHKLYIEWCLLYNTTTRNPTQSQCAKNALKAFRLLNY